MRQYFRQMGRLGLVLGGWVLLGGTGWGEEKMDRTKALAELTALVAKNEKMTREVLSKAARDLAEAGAGADQGGAGLFGELSECGIWADAGWGYAFWRLAGAGEGDDFFVSFW